MYELDSYSIAICILIGLCDFLMVIEYWQKKARIVDTTDILTYGTNRS